MRRRKIGGVKPGDIFVGVSEFFAVLLPGAVLTFAGAYVASRFGVQCDGLRALGLSDAHAWWALAIVSYTIGHIVASWGARLDELYDERKTAHRNMALLKCADSILKGFLAEAATLDKDVVAETDKPARSLLARAVGKLTKNAWTGTSKSGSPMINAYKLSRVRLNRRAPALASEVIRLEADSKFFRGLVVVAVLMMPLWLALIVEDVVAAARRVARLGWSWEVPAAAAWDALFFVMTVFTLRLAYARFCELRLKATETAFHGLVCLAVEETVPNQDSARDRG